MTLLERLDEYVWSTFAHDWSTRDGQQVPSPDSIQLGNKGVHLDATVLYADLDGSTNLVDSFDPTFAAEVYKTYLYCAAKIIRQRVGTIVSYDGDRIMAVFTGRGKNSRAAKAALQINWAVTYLINPHLHEQYGDEYSVRQVVGIDTSPLMAARTGIRGTNDLVWVGRAANHAAKLTELSSDYPTWVTEQVFRQLSPSAKASDDGDLMWDADTWRAMGGVRVYRSDWHWSL